MSDSIHQPHDKLFRQIMSDPEEAEAFLRVYLPTDLYAQFEWSALRQLETTFIDEEFLKRESDVLYLVKHKALEEPIYLYLLFEHQSTPDKWIRRRLWTYIDRIWAESFKHDAKQEMLKPVLPLVFYQGKESWSYSTSFADLFPEAARDWSFVPNFTHFLVDHSGLEPKAVQGGLKAQVMQLLMLAAFHHSVKEALQLAAQLLVQLPTTGGVDYLLVFMRYLSVTQERETVDEFVQAVTQRAPKIGGEMMTYAEELLQEGEIKGKLETIEGFLKAGIGWPIIEAATGVDEEAFALLKRQLAEMTRPAMAGQSQQAPGTKRHEEQN